MMDTSKKAIWGKDITKINRSFEMKVKDIFILSSYNETASKWIESEEKMKTSWFRDCVDYFSPGQEKISHSHKELKKLSECERFTSQLMNRQTLAVIWQTFNVVQDVVMFTIPRILNSSIVTLIEHLFTGELEQKEIHEMKLYFTINIIHTMCQVINKNDATVSLITD